MPHVDMLERQLVEFGYELRESEMAERTLFGWLSGGALGTLRTTIRATDSSCTLGVFLGILDVVPEPHRYTLLLDLLELNYSHLFGRVCMFRATDPKSKTPTYGIIVAETTFFWTELTKAKLDGRTEGLYSISLAASRILAGKDGIVKANPFYKELRPSPPPVARQSLPRSDPDTEQTPG